MAIIDKCVQQPFSGAADLANLSKLFQLAAHKAVQKGLLEQEGQYLRIALGREVERHRQKRRSSFASSTPVPQGGSDDGDSGCPLEDDDPHNLFKFSMADKENEDDDDAGAYHQRFGDVDTPQVKERLIWSFLPRLSRDTLTTYIRSTPDLYGSFWVCVTLVFCIAIMGNEADYMHSGGEGQHWRYHFRKVSISASTICCYALLVPSVLWGFLWWKKKLDEKPVLGLMELVSLYGYSLVIYIPISILWAVPFAWFQWAIVIVGATLIWIDSGSLFVTPVELHSKGCCRRNRRTYDSTLLAGCEVHPRLPVLLPKTTKALPLETAKPSSNITTRVGEANKVKDSVKTR